MENTENKNLEMVEATEEKKPEGFFTKVGGAIKKHGKKILTVAGIAAVGLVAYALGKNSTVTDSDGCYEDETVDADFEELVEVE